ncbi:serine/threonine-protein kinase 11-interacting protein isoform X2 [Clupea harengus]|uniref:Serine/threonine-protein kinase 11-interacting protein n=1 Tax=Clupea harengus TaxID=7950 RepID=A0A6P8EPD3_CLUHA|nr:serine/threonine-protein kinase 11-interacting protein isoform X2 [Clupea harengus]
MNTSSPHLYSSFGPSRPPYGRVAVCSRRCPSVCRLRMSTTPSSQPTLVHRLATLLRNNGDCVLDGSSTLTLQVSHLQHLTRLFEQHLISRTHQHGFLALPSHPADTASLLQVQFLFDVLQKTLSMKLVNPPDSRLQSVVKIFPFKSLKHLELKRIPPHCLEGLRGVYSQLEVFTCSKSLSSLEELLSLCGGDLSSALPWLELHTLNFSYNSISCLDESLSLLNVLKSLDLSHNKIQDCADFLKPLSDLEHLNLAYNNLQRAPQLGLSARVKLSVLILRNNELETINGLEQLGSLQHLDLAYNLLLEHSQLAPLSQLHCLNLLILEGTPLFFQKTHRSSTVCHLSPRAAFQRFRLDGCLLSTSELAVLPKPGVLIGQMAQAHAPALFAAATERGSQEFSSGGGDLSDSLSVSEPGVSRLRKKKSKGKVRVRRASISEPSDTDHELRVGSTLQDIVLHHQKDIERMDSFREQLGEDWLRYQHHLDASAKPPTPPPQLTMPDTPHITPHVTPPVIPNGLCTPSPSPPKDPTEEKTALAEAPDCASPLLTSEPRDEMDTTESTLQWSHTDSTLERSDPNASALLTSTTQAEEDEEDEEEEDRGVDLCLPLLVGVVSEDEEGEERKAPGPVFLRVRQGLLLEVDMQHGRVRRRVELDSLQHITSIRAPWGDKEDSESLPALELHFSFIIRERRQRCYVMLDENPQQALQDLFDILSRVAEENMRRVEERRPRGLRLQCLRCRTEFSQRGPEGSPGASDRLDASQGLRGCGDRGEEEEEQMEGEKEDEHARKNTAGSGQVCPECNSDHVIQIAGQLAPSTSTPTASDVEEGDEKRYFSFDDTDTPKRAPGVSNLESQSESSLDSNGHLTQEVTKTEGEQNDTFLTATSSMSQVDPRDEDCGWAEQSASQPVSYHTADGGTDLSSTTESQEDQELAGSYRYSQLPETQAQASDRASPASFDLLSEDFEAVDHRLKLFLDVEVFEGEEELHSFLKMSTVKFGDPVEFPSLLVLSDQCIYILEITSEAQGQPSDWMQKRYRHRLCELSYLEVGLGSQGIHMEFADSGGSAYTLLVRDSSRCKRFYNRLTGIVRELAPRSDSKLKAISTTRLTPQHHLWPLVCEGSQSHEDEDDCQPQFLYVLAFVRQDHSLTPVTVLATRETLYLVDEDHQWSKSHLPELPPNEDGEVPCGRVTVRETQPISCVSSVHLFSSNPCRVDIKLYDEVLKQERMWALQTEGGELVQGLVEWVRTQWEAMFGVKLTTSTQEQPC